MIRVQDLVKDNSPLTFLPFWHRSVLGGKLSSDFNCSPLFLCHMVWCCGGGGGVEKGLGPWRSLSSTATVPWRYWSPQQVSQVSIFLLLFFQKVHKSGTNLQKQQVRTHTSKHHHSPGLQQGQGRLYPLPRGNLEAHGMGPNPSLPQSYCSPALQRHTFHLPCVLFIWHD